MVERLMRERLPDRWSYGVTDDGRVFFIDDANHVTAWIHPILGYPIQSGHYTDESLPMGWEMSVDVLGRPYFIDHHAHKTTYTHPQFVDSPQYSPPEMMKMKVDYPGPFGDKQSNLRKSFSRSKSLSEPPSAKRDPYQFVTRCGWLYKQEGGFLKSWKKRWCVLSECNLFFYKNETEVNKVGSIVLAGYWINALEKSEKTSHKYALVVEHKDTKPLYLAAETEDEMREWLNELTRAAAVPELTPRQPPSMNDGAIYPDYNRNLPTSNPPVGQNSTNVPYDYETNNYIRDPDQANNVYRPHMPGLRDTRDASHQNNTQAPVYGVVLRKKPDGSVQNRHSGDQMNRLSDGFGFTVPEPSATSTPLVNMNNLSWNDIPERENQRFPMNGMSPNTNRTNASDRRDGASLQYYGDGRYPERLPPGGDTVYGSRSPQQMAWNAPGQYGASPSNRLSQNDIQDRREINAGTSNFNSYAGPNEFPVAGRLSSPRTMQERPLNSQNSSMSHLNSKYSHEQTPKKKKVPTATLR